MSARDQYFTNFILPLVTLVLLGLLGSALDASEGARGRGARHFPNIPLITHEGEVVRFYDDLIENRVVAVNFIYTSCKDSCPAETAKLRKVYELLGDRVGRDIFMYSISIDPGHDTPQVLAEFVKNFKIGPGWTFLTGKEADITLLQKKLGLYLDEEDLEHEGDHNISFVVGNDRTGKCIQRSPFDDPHVLANLIGYRLFDGMVRRSDSKSYADVPEAPRHSHGEGLYLSRCNTCHTIGGGELLGPDLLGVTEKRDRAWLLRWLKEPDVMLEEGDPIALELSARYPGLTMPNLRLDDVDAAALVEYMEKESNRAFSKFIDNTEGKEDAHAAHAQHVDHAEMGHHDHAAMQ